MYKVKTNDIYNGKIFDIKSYEITENQRVYKREVVHKSSVAVILGVTKNNKIVLVKQNRFAVGEDLFELPAGHLEPGESDVLAAAREFKEETGFEMGSLDKILEFYSSPGFTDEKLILFKGIVGEKSSTSFDYDENIETYEFYFEDIKKMIISGTIKDGKTILGICLYEGLVKG